MVEDCQQQHILHKCFVFEENRYSIVRGIDTAIVKLDSPLDSGNGIMTHDSVLTRHAFLFRFITLLPSVSLALPPFTLHQRPQKQSPPYPRFPYLTTRPHPCRRISVLLSDVLADQQDLR